MNETEYKNERMNRKKNPLLQYKNKQQKTSLSRKFFIIFFFFRYESISGCSVKIVVQIL